MKPIVAIVGRPNVGKSTLFNNLVGDKVAIVDDMPGVTRDRLYRETSWCDCEFVIVDTGGLEPRNNDFMMSKIKEQAEVAMNEADVILFIVDAKSGLNPLDEEIATVLRKKQKPVILCVNKVDDFTKQQDDIYDFYALGFDYLVPISGAHKVNLGDMLDIIVDIIGKLDIQEDEVTDALKLAIIGKPNAGKSSLVNKLSGQQRTIVSDIAGTTRDAIDTMIEYKDKKYMLIDTAGIRRKSKVEESLEYYSVLRAIKTIKRADICILMLDANEGLTEQDKRIAGIAAEETKPIIIVMNKWDLVDKNKTNMKKIREELMAELPFLSYAPIEFVSALTGQRTTNLLELSDKIFEEYSKRISTGLLNTVLKDAIIMNMPPTRKGRVIKINYATQYSVAPPKFALFCNYPELIHFSYQRYIENKFREAFGFEGSPMIITFQKKNESFE